MNIFKVPKLCINMVNIVVSYLLVKITGPVYRGIAIHECAVIIKEITDYKRPPVIVNNINVFLGFMLPQSTDATITQ